MYLVSYFATSHGKGPVDGIGGNVKRFAEKIVRLRNFIVSNAQEFHDAVLGLQNIKTFCVLKKNNTIQFKWRVVSMMQMILTFKVVYKYVLVFEMEHLF